MWLMSLVLRTPPSCKTWRLWSPKIHSLPFQGLTKASCATSTPAFRQWRHYQYFVETLGKADFNHKLRLSRWIRKDEQGSSHLKNWLLTNKCSTCQFRRQMSIHLHFSDRLPHLAPRFSQEILMSSHWTTSRWKTVKTVTQSDKPGLTTRMNRFKLRTASMPLRITHWISIFVKKMSSVTSIWIQTPSLPSTTPPEPRIPMISLQWTLIYPMMHMHADLMRQINFNVKILKRSCQTNKILNPR